MDGHGDTSYLRSVAVGAAMCCDIACNYPLWIAAKRMGANLSPFPSDFKNLYKGGGALWLSLGPTTMVEDKVTSVLNQAFGNNDQDGLHGLLSAATSGMVAAVLVTSQVEYLITASHATATSINATIKNLFTEHGIQHILLPPGMLAMVGREVPFASALFYVRPVMYSHIMATDGMSSHCASSNSISLHKFGSSLLCGILTSMLVTPISQAPSVIAAYQQGHGVSAAVAFRDISQRYGWRGFFRGLGARTFSLAGTFTIVPLALERLGGFLTRESD